MVRDESDGGTFGELSGDAFDPFDDLDDDLASEPTAPLPLPPEDRIWRHPSELAYSNPDAAVFARRAQPSRSTIVVGVLAGLAGAAVATAVFLLTDPREPTVERVVEHQLVPTTAVLASSLRSNSGGIDVVGIAEAVKPAIVRIDIEVNDTLIGGGSGVLFRDDGHLLTNAHVVGAGTGISVILADGRRYEGKIVGADELTDIAVVKIDADGPLPVVVLGDTQGLRVGEPAVAIGSPLRLQGGPTVTVGVVSALGRTVDPADGHRLHDLVQTDAPISPGSSGGALVDRTGSVIGITTAIAVSEVGAEGLGFATPIELAYGVAVDLMTIGKASHGYVGISGADADPDEVAAEGLAGAAQVTSVESGSPADAAGLRQGDVIIAVDGEAVTSMTELVVTIRRIDPGETHTVTVMRDGETFTTTVVVGERPD